MHAIENLLLWFVPLSIYNSRVEMISVSEIEDQNL
jgi:hypothetical protein